MSDIEFNRYKNIIIFAEEWRKYKIDNVLGKEDFRKAMQSDQYVRLDCLDNRKDRVVHVYLFDKNSKYVLSSPDMKKLLKKIKDPCQLILITYQVLNVYHRKAIASQKHLTVSVYRHEIFDLVVPHGPLCYSHRVMSRDEVIKLTNEDLCCYVINLPKIYDEDPQCIWIGAEVGDVVEIKMLSDIAGIAYQYRVVIPKSGKVIAYKDIDPDAAPTAEEDDDDVQEHRENKNTNNSDVEDDEDEEPVPED
jgi:DNA-directed RNA polymerase subunit H (RpoH/RPB5)